MMLRRGRLGPSAPGLVPARPPGRRARRFLGVPTTLSVGAAPEKPGRVAPAPEKCSHGRPRRASLTRGVRSELLCHVALERRAPRGKEGSRWILRARASELGGTAGAQAAG